MSIQSKFAKIKAQGFFRTLEVKFNRFVPPWVFRYSMGDIFDLDIGKLISLNDQKTTGEGLVIKCLDESSDSEERKRLRDFTWNSVPVETTHNDLGYMIYDSQNPQKILGGVWAGLESFSENNLGVSFQFEDHQAWLYCAFVHGDARGRGVYKKLISFVAGDLEQRGFSQLLGIVQPWNKISRRMHQKHSRGICGRVAALRLFGLVWITAEGNVELDRRLVTSIISKPARVLIGSANTSHVKGRTGNAGNQNSRKDVPVNIFSSSRSRKPS